MHDTGSAAGYGGLKDAGGTGMGGGQAAPDANPYAGAAQAFHMQGQYSGYGAPQVITTIPTPDTLIGHADEEASRQLLHLYSCKWCCARSPSNTPWCQVWLSRFAVGAHLLPPILLLLTVQ